VVHVRRAVTRAGGVGEPKSVAGRRTVSIPPHVVPVVDAHLRTLVAADPGALLFSAGNGGNLAPTTLQKSWHPARDAAGRPDLYFHDLRHTGATLAAATGATLADLMARLGHSTPVATMRYQHAASDRDKAIGEALSGSPRQSSLRCRGGRNPRTGENCSMRRFCCPGCRATGASWCGAASVPTRRGDGAVRC
jgi:integrase